MKSVLLLLSAASAFALSAAAPHIGSEVTLERPGGSSYATISYTLKGAPDIVTLDIETNALDNAAGEWVSIGGENIQSLKGAVNRVVRAKTTIWESMSSRRGSWFRLDMR